MKVLFSIITIFILLMPALSQVSVYASTAAQNNSTESYAECQKKIGDDMQMVVNSINKTKAILLATSSNDFQSKVSGSKYVFSGIFTNMTENQETCDDVKLTSVVIEFSILDNNSKFVKFVAVGEDPSLTQVTLVEDVFVQKCDNNCPPPGPPATGSIQVQLSPLKQIASGVTPKDVTCKSGFALVLKAENQFPACVKPDTAIILIELGWAKEFVQSVRVTSSDLCEGIEIPSGNLRTGMVPVLMMKPNSTATVCVTYQFISDWNSYPNKDIYPHGIFETCCLVHMGKSSTVTSSNQFEVLANPPLFNVTGVYNESKITVMYKIHAGLDSSGFYDSSIPYGNCNSYPLAVDYDSSQVDASDFSYNMDIPCFNTIDKVDSVKIVSGMNYKQVTFR